MQYATNRTGSWQEETVATGNIQSGPAVTVTDNNQVLISFGQGTTIRLADNSGSGWSISQIAAEEGMSTSLVTDSEGKIHIIYYDYSNGDLEYLSNYSGNWGGVTLDLSGDVGDTCDIVIDSANRIHASYYDATNGDLKYVTTAD